ncbi:response regulator [Paenibacillus cisolokensis]|uniref:response regulator n=1 Tax=Paenibacillus cisolokensis TaxID=1658519 RepID=UPI003D295086
MKVLIVDDEEIIREGLSSVISWSELGLTLLPPASSAEEALERLPVDKPHIILTDIRMSGITGLEMADEAKERLPDVEIIILSGHNDFAYAQKAIRQGVVDYLLKTSPPEDIIQTVLKAKQRLQERWADKTREDRMARDEKERQFYKWVIQGEPVPGELPSFIGESFTRSGEDPGAYQWQVLILEAQGWNGPGYSASLLLFAVQNMLQDLLPYSAFAIQKDSLVGLMAVGAGGEPAGAEPQDGWLHLIGRVENLLKCNIRLAIGETVTSVEQAHQSYTAAASVFRYFHLLSSKVLDYRVIASRQGGKMLLSQEEETALGTLLLDNDPVALNRWVEGLYETLSADPQSTFESAEACLQSAAVAGYRWLERTLRTTGREEELRMEPWLQTEREGLLPRGALFRYLHEIMDHYHTHLGDGSEAHVRRAKAFVESSSLREISLQQVAGHLHLHPGHLGELFRKVTGTTFGDYVTELRMKRAMELLAASPAKVSEISLLIGYEDVKYFSRLFKKHVGKTPSEYREETQAGSEVKAWN